MLTKLLGLLPYIDSYTEKLCRKSVWSGVVSGLSSNGSSLQLLLAVYDVTYGWCALVGTSCKRKPPTSSLELYIRAVRCNYSLLKNLQGESKL